MRVVKKLLHPAGVGVLLLLACGSVRAGVEVYVAYAENERSPAFFPNPWLGSPNTTFLGYPGTAWDTGAILIVNTGATDIVLGQGVRVDGFRDPTRSFQLWDSLITPQGVTIHPGSQVILAQTGAQDASGQYTSAQCIRGVTPGATCYSNFDSSDTPVGSPKSSATPQIHLVFNGTAQTFTDSGQILNTGGFDFGNDLGRNEAVQWRLVGTTGPLYPGGSGVRPPPVRTWHNDNSRTGLNFAETTLTPPTANGPGNVNNRTFGKLFSYRVDGQVYAQPLFVPDVPIPNKGKHNVVYVVTENDSVYAFDAETNVGSGGLLWGPMSLGTPVPKSEVVNQCGNISPAYGITGTPVIDPNTNTLYVVSSNRQSPGVSTAVLHALDLSNGQEKFSGPQTIGGTFAGTGDGSVNGHITFDATHQLQRPALLLHNRVVYVAFGSHCDAPQYHGWVFGYSAANVTQQMAIFNTTPNAVSVTSTAACPGWGGFDPAGGAIWMGGAGLASDSTGIYGTTGNGHFDANTGNADYADTILKLTPPANAGPLVVADSFTPYDQRTLECHDADLGAGGFSLLPGTTPPLLVQLSKPGTLYLVNRTTGQMGGFDASCPTPGPSCDHIVQEIAGAVQADSDRSPAFFNNTIYIQGWMDKLKAFTLQNGLITPAAPAAQTDEAYNDAGGTPSISYDANTGVMTGIVWSIEDKGGGSVLHAFAANNLQELYRSDSVGSRDALEETPGFIVPTVAAGKVYVGTNSTLDVYGGSLALPAPPPGPAGVHQLYFNSSGWSDQDLSRAAAGTPIAGGSGLTSFDDAPGEHSFATGVDQHIHQLYFNGSWVDQDLTRISGGSAVGAGSGLASFADGYGEHAFYISDRQQDVHQLYYSGGWVDQDLTNMTKGATPGIGSALAAFADRYGEHAYFIGVDRHVHQLYFDNSAWADQDLTVITDGSYAVAGSGLAAFGDGYGEHVYFVGFDQHVHQLYFNNAGWRDQDLTVVTAGQLATPDSALSGFADSYGEHAYFIGLDQHVHQLYFNNVGWSDQDLTTITQGALASVGSALASFADGYGEHAYFIGLDQHVHQLYFNNSSWADQDLTNAAHGATPVTGSSLAAFADGAGEHAFFLGPPPPIVVPPRCAPGFTRCGTACVNLTNNPRNCGACGHACGLGGFCVNGSCKTASCPPGTIPCCGGDLGCRLPQKCPQTCP